MFSLMGKVMCYFSQEKEKERLIKAIKDLCKKNNLEVPKDLEKWTLGAVRKVYYEKLDEVKINNITIHNAY